MGVEQQFGQNGYSYLMRMEEERAQQMAYQKMLALQNEAKVCAPDKTNDYNQVLLLLEE